MNRPRCREWLPLATQQLRLRNLIRILGVNIECTEERRLVYYTLHYRKDDDKAFYTSEALPQRHPQLKWAEITCSDMIKSNANCVCIKVWARSEQIQELQMDSTEHNKSQSSAFIATESPITQQSANDVKRPQADQLLFCWGVYFSGLIVLSQLVDTKCSPNSLIFQINGDYFASPDYFSADFLREQLSLRYERLAECLPKNSLPLPPDAYSINSPRGSRSASPVAQDLLQMSKVRYVELDCDTKEVRVSYSLQQLLRIQELQRLHLQRVRESEDIAADIKQLCVRCITKEQLVRRRRRTTSMQHQHNQQYHSMGRTLSVLLSEQQQIDPQKLLLVQRVQEEGETLRARQRLLQSERAAYTERIDQLQQRLSTLTQKRNDLQTWLHERNEEMCIERQQVDDQIDELNILQQAKRRLILNMERRMATLCLELREIYPLGRDAHDFNTVCGVPFPSIDSYASETSQASSASIEHVSPMALSVSLGYVAHLVEMMAVILNRPLRNPIIHEGSHSRIMDVIKDITYASREFPLYSRSSSLLPKPVKYAIFLLNQNIAQLCYDITGRRSDLRATIENIRHIFLILEELELHQREVGGSMINFRVEKQNGAVQTNSTNDTNYANISVNVSAIDGAMGLALDGHDNEFLSKSNSSDMNHVLSPPTVHAMTVATDKITALFEPILTVGQSGNRTDRTHVQQRSCRSVGSYSDCEEEVEGFKNVNMNERCYSNSDSNLNVKRGGRV